MKSLIEKDQEGFIRFSRHFTKSYNKRYIRLHSLLKDRGGELLIIMVIIGHDLKDK